MPRINRWKPGARICAAVIVLLPALIGSGPEIRNGHAQALDDRVYDARNATRRERAPLPAPRSVEYRLQAGDRLAVTIFGHEDLTGEFVLDGDGRITFPLLGTLQLGGRTLRGAEAHIVERLRPDYLRQPYAGIQVLNPRPIYVLGEVKNPGSYTYRSGLTVTEAVALAGGFTFRADREDIAISRRRGDGRQRRAASADSRVLPGDTIQIDSGLF